MNINFHFILKVVILALVKIKLMQIYLINFRYVQDCHLDLLFSGNAGTASLHLKHLKEDCLNNISLKNGDDENKIIKEQNALNGRFSNTDARRGRGVSLSGVSETTSSSLVPVSSVVDSLCIHDCSGNGNCDSGKKMLMFCTSISISLISNIFLIFILIIY